MLCSWVRHAQGVENRRALDDNRGLLVAGQVRDGCLVDAPSCVNVHSVCDLEGSLAFIWVLSLVLSRRGEKKTAVGGEGETPEERGECLVGI